MTDTINGPRLFYASTVEVDFGWTPAGTETYTAPNGIVLSGPSAAVNTALTFTATTTIDGDLSGTLTIVEYYWDFGDGIIGWGSPIAHTYVVANFQARTMLRATDSLGRQWFMRRQMYVQ